MKNNFYMNVADDMHSHLRQGEMLEFTVESISKGGCNRVLVMPNTTPIISSCKDAKEYLYKLKKYDEGIHYLMTLYLNKDTDEYDILSNYQECNLQGVKVYPSNVTTNSSQGITSLEPYYKVFHVLEKLNKSVHIHCEEPNINPLYAEERYLPHIHDLAVKFPNLNIVLEHISSSESINVIKQFSNVAGTITPHHLYLTIDDVVNMDIYDRSIDTTSIEKYIKNKYHYCKPLPKLLEDKIALQNVIKEDFPRVFLGSDSAPHYKFMKCNPHYKPGIYTQPFLVNYVAHILNKFDALDKIENFTSKNASAFLNLTDKKEISDYYLYVHKRPFKLPQEYNGVVPFLSGETLDFDIQPVYRF
ncbi:dihydroorotase, putative [Plasmodium sp. gorilla clade G2]|uniref:dihydroorotase, putative n=1 Tax=Plasmodium sp. gorilla clade G2 TaxID=880535 RepID=UPI000D216BE0|nr:dihydroorotase, putative [Plasmodium sp. gorilla clade G2]SOV19944.1 dihydroorotase, putative [Plasmodium sp. gorilla clade G2]